MAMPAMFLLAWLDGSSHWHFVIRHFEHSRSFGGFVEMVPSPYQFFYSIRTRHGPGGRVKVHFNTHLSNVDVVVLQVVGSGIELLPLSAKTRLRPWLAKINHFTATLPNLSALLVNSRPLAFVTPSTVWTNLTVYGQHSLRSRISPVVRVKSRTLNVVRS
jgi:hypothetical protein